MRSAVIAAGGALLSLGAYVTSAHIGGLVGAAVFTLAIALPPVAFGIAIGLVIDNHESGHAISSGWINSNRQSDGCACGRIRMAMGGVLVCSNCDVVGPLLP